MIAILGALIVSGALLAFGCASAETKPARSEPVQTSPLEHYLPLTNGHVYSYDTERESSGERGVLVLRVARPRPDLAELIGGRTERIAFEADGIAYASGGYLLKAPLSEGATWKGRSGIVRLVNAHKSIQVPAGSFSDCLETVEEAPNAGSKIITVFCPDVGIVLIDAQGQVGEDFDRELARLRYYGPAVDLEVGTPPAQ